jgi:hypothetical protein
VRPLPWVASGLAILVIAGAIGVALRSNRTFTGVTDSTPTTSGVPTVTRAETPLTPASASPESAALEKPLDDKAIKELLGTDPDWKPPPQISAERIFQDYSSNELAAERKYQKAFVVVGVVDDIGRQLITGEAYASLHGGNVQAWFHKDDEPELRTLKVGDRAMLLCLGGSGRTLGIVILKTCDRYR